MHSSVCGSPTFPPVSHPHQEPALAKPGKPHCISVPPKLLKAESYLNLFELSCGTVVLWPPTLLASVIWNLGSGHEERRAKQIYILPSAKTNWVHVPRRLGGPLYFFVACTADLTFELEIVLSPLIWSTSWRPRKHNLRELTSRIWEHGAKMVRCYFNFRFPLVGYPAFFHPLEYDELY